MKIAIIADDLTGANDCGGQLVHYGMDVSVKLDAEFTRRETEGVVIFNTDSRSLSAAEAKATVKTSVNTSPGNRLISSTKKSTAQ